MTTSRLLRFLICCFLTIGCLCGCRKNSFTVEGKIDGASNEPVVLEKADFNGRWIAVDSTRTSSSGKFSISREALPYPEIFRLVYNGDYIYFPVDSTETVTVNAKATGFSTDYTLQGSPEAVAMAEFDHIILQLPANSVPDSLTQFKKEIYSRFIQPNPASVVSYYILTRQLGDTPLFSPSAGSDYKYFAAIATGYRDSRPDDPRTRLLTETSVDAMKRRNAAKGIYREMEAEEISLIDINLPDEKGENVRLSSIAGKGVPVVVLFSLMNHEDSPVLNYELSKLLKEKGNSFRIYHVALDADRYAWREAAANLPWTTVFDPDGIYSSNVSAYNVTEVPVFFIYNSKGDLTDRVSDVNQLKRKL